MASVLFFLVSLVIGVCFAVFLVFAVAFILLFSLIFLYTLPFTCWVGWTEADKKYPILYKCKLFQHAKYATKFYKHLFFHKALDF